jgi:hypothetical protein
MSVSLYGCMGVWVYVPTFGAVLVVLAAGVLKECPQFTRVSWRTIYFRIARLAPKPADSVGIVYE